MIKKAGKSLLSKILEAQVKALLRRNEVKVVAVAGSVGKTSTKIAVATVLGESMRVRYQDGNYNDRLTVPLIFFDRQEPSIFDILAWVRLLISNFRVIKKPYPFDVVVVELGTDAPGQMRRFRYLRPDLLILTAIAPEHMENFNDLEAVAKEELSMNAAAKTVLINRDDCEDDYVNGFDHLSYGLNSASDYGLKGLVLKGIAGSKATMLWPDGMVRDIDIRLAGRQGAKICLAAGACADMIGMDRQAAFKAMSSLKPVSGRMNRLEGVNDCIIIDDTYNSSPSAATAALDVLYATKGTKRIALLGSMNELGAFSRQAHESVGSYCDPRKVDLVITLGKEANEFLAPAAQARGCEVVSFDDPKVVGEYLRPRLDKHTVLLAKGSQNGVYAEEALKPLLKQRSDVSKLVRQSAYWLSKKES